MSSYKYTNNFLFRGAHIVGVYYAPADMWFYNVKESPFIARHMGGIRRGCWVNAEGFRKAMRGKGAEVIAMILADRMTGEGNHDSTTGN